MKTRALSPILLGLMLFAGPTAAGCQSGPPAKKLVDVWGRVTFDGVPLEGGLIDFEHAPGGWTQGSVSIENGRYASALSPGSYLVKIYSSHPGKPGDPGYQPGGMIMFIPERYNAKSTLNLSVPEGGGEFSFELSGWPQPQKVQSRGPAKSTP